MTKEIKSREQRELERRVYEELYAYQEEVHFEREREVREDYDDEDRWIEENLQS